MPAEFEFAAIGTSWKIDILDEVSEQEASFLQKTIQDRIEVFDINYSRFREDSLVSEMSRRAGTYTLPEDAKPLLDMYQKLYQSTGGMLTPLIGKLMEETGYDAKYSLIPTELHHPAKWEDTLAYNFPNLTLKHPALLDFGALGKGYAIDIVSDILRAKNIQSFTVDAGQDIFYQNKKNDILRVGLENPENFEEVIGVVELNNQSICGSSGSRRKWKNFHHIMHPFALEPVRHIVSTWAVASTALEADALASALFFVPGSFLKTEYNFEYVVLYSNFSVDKSDAFPGELFFK